MQVHYGLENLYIVNPVVTIGSFDGVHKGHVQVIQGLKKVAATLKGESVIITFDPHPREVLYPLEKRPGILTTLEEKINMLEQHGIAHVVVVRFTTELAALSYEDFVKHILIDKVGIKGLVVGYDHRFGKDRQGNFDVLKLLADKYHFFIEQEKVYITNQVNVSSTKIRTALELGEVDKVNEFLGYEYSISGKVVHGDKIGRKMGFPTANIEVSDLRKLLPATGVYAVKVKVDGQNQWGMLNVGIRPTVSQSGIIRLEVNIFDFDREIYGKDITISLLGRIRGERKFDNIAELQLQLQEDRKDVLAFCR